MPRVIFILFEQMYLKPTLLNSGGNNFGKSLGQVPVVSHSSLLLFAAPAVEKEKSLNNERWHSPFVIACNCLMLRWFELCKFFNYNVQCVPGVLAYHCSPNFYHARRDKVLLSIIHFGYENKNHSGIASAIGINLLFSFWDRYELKSILPMIE